MSFEEELEKIKKLLQENAYLSKKEFDIFYNSVVEDLKMKYPEELSNFWARKIKSGRVDRKTIRYGLKSLLY